MHVVTIETAELGDRSYLVHDGEIGIVVDPQRDLDRIEQAITAAGVRIGLVLETHVHNDYLSGGLELARRTGAGYVLAGAEPVGFERIAVADGTLLEAGSLRVRVLATPGHTEHHTAYLVTGDDSPGAVFTGGSLLFGSVGRTDLVDPARTEELTRAQYRSARRLAAGLPAATQVFPTHGFGSFCSAGQTSGASHSTIEAERAANDALVTAEEDFVARLITGLISHPSYYARMGPRNRAGAGPADLSPPRRMDAEDLGQHLAAGTWVVDLRSRTAYAAGHLAGSVGIELGEQFSTYVGWLIPWGTPVVLLGDSADQVAAAQRQLVRIGIDRPAGTADLAALHLTGSYPRVGFEALVAGVSGPVLDVRRDDERANGHVTGSAHCPIHRLLDRVAELPAGTLWVHCESGLRAGIAASLLARAGRDVVLIDDDYAHATALGLTTEPAQPSRRCWPHRG